MKKEEFLKLFRENEAIKSVLQTPKDERERKAIKAHSEDMFLRLYEDLIKPITEQLEKDPEGMSKAWSEIEKELIKDNNTDKA
jgi:hypothetical protein